jgi:hypothetical protein
MCLACLRLLLLVSALFEVGGVYEKSPPCAHKKKSQITLLPKLSLILARARERDYVLYSAAKHNPSTHKKNKRIKMNSC